MIALERSELLDLFGLPHVQEEHLLLLDVAIDLVRLDAAIRTVFQLRLLCGQLKREREARDAGQ